MNDEQPQSKPIDISVDNIEINQSKMQRDPKSIAAENKIIKRQNLILKKQLESLSSRLDSQITKRINSQRKETQSEDVTILQLQNSYKKCQMYKKEAMVYRKKYQTLTEDPRFADFERKIVGYQKENTDLKNEIKHLNKILKSQSKGLAELGFEEYPSIVMERDQLKEDVRIFKKQLAQYRRSVDVKNKIKKGNSNTMDLKGYSSSENNHSLENGEEVGESINQGGTNEQNTLKHSRQNELETLHKKIEKESQKTKSLQAERNKLRDLVDNLKAQLAERQKQNSHLRDKINELRSNNQLLQSNVVKSGSRSNENELKKIKIKHRYVESEQSTEEMRPRYGQKIKKKLVNKRVRSDPENKNDISNSKSVMRRQDTEDRANSLIKWNHQHLSSMIKELQILEHQHGHIKDLHVRYQKGEPKKYSTYGGKNNYKIFACSSEEYIKQVEGVFDQGYLQYLVVTSNYNRVEKYGKYQLYENSIQGEHFRFEVGEDAFPGALFGSKDSHGIIRLGCFIHKES